MYISISTSISISIYLSVYLSMHTYMYISIYICIYKIYIHIHIHINISCGGGGFSRGHVEIGLDTLDNGERDGEMEDRLPAGAHIPVGQLFKLSASLKLTNTTNVDAFVPQTQYVNLGIVGQLGNSLSTNGERDSEVEDRLPAGTQIPT